MKKIILTESELHRVISKSVKRILKEHFEDYDGPEMDGRITLDGKEYDLLKMSEEERNRFAEYCGKMADIHQRKADRLKRLSQICDEFIDALNDWTD